MWLVMIGWPSRAPPIGWVDSVALSSLPWWFHRPSRTQYYDNLWQAPGPQQRRTRCPNISISSLPNNGFFIHQSLSNYNWSLPLSWVLGFNLEACKRSYFDTMSKLIIQLYYQVLRVLLIQLIMPLRNVSRFQPVIQEFGCIRKEESKNVRCCCIAKFIKDVGLFVLFLQHYPLVAMHVVFVCLCHETVFFYRTQ